MSFSQGGGDGDFGGECDIVVAMVSASQKIYCLLPDRITLYLYQQSILLAT